MISELTRIIKDRKSDATNFSRFILDDFMALEIFYYLIPFFNAQEPMNPQFLKIIGEGSDFGLDALVISFIFNNTIN